MTPDYQISMGELRSQDDEDDVAVGIVNWNCSEETIACARHIRSLFPRVAIVVVDNGSDAEDSSRLRRNSAFDSLRLLPSNGGYGAGMNVAGQVASQLGRKWLWMTNPDSRPAAGSLNLMMSFAAGAVAVGSLQRTSDDMSVPGHAYVSAAHIIRNQVIALVCEGCADGFHEVDVLTGTGLLVKLTDFLEVGGFNEIFFHYKEEYDLIRRLSTRGSVRHVCSADIWHRRGGSLSAQSPTAQYYRVRNEILYMRQSKEADYPARLAKFALQSLLAVLRRPQIQTQGRATVLGLYHGARGITGQARLQQKASE